MVVKLQKKSLCNHGFIFGYDFDEIFSSPNHTKIYPLVSRMDFSKCCPWCDQTFGSKRTLYRHKNERHSLEFKASQLKNSDPDEETFVRCICCNLWTLNNAQSIKSHESSALHKSRQPVPNKKRKSEASSSQQFPFSSSVSNESLKLKKQKGESLHPSSRIAANFGKICDRSFVVCHNVFKMF